MHATITRSVHHDSHYGTEIRYKITLPNPFYDPITAYSPKSVQIVLLRHDIAIVAYDGEQDNGLMALLEQVGVSVL